MKIIIEFQTFLRYFCFEIKRTTLEFSNDCSSLHSINMSNLPLKFESNRSNPFWHIVEASYDTIQHSFQKNTFKNSSLIKMKSELTINKHTLQANRASHYRQYFYISLKFFIEDNYFWLFVTTRMNVIALIPYSCFSSLQLINWSLLIYLS